MRACIGSVNVSHHPMEERNCCHAPRYISLLATLLLAACAGDRAHIIRVSVADQRMALYEHGVEVQRFPISTSKFGLGDVPGSNRTPVGTMEIAKKIGAAVPVGMKFKSRVPTGEIVPVNAPGRDPIVTRILWLRGLESRNANAFSRMIYIHGTPEERTLGSPSSYGCIRMRSKDIVQLFDAVGSGARVVVDTAPLPEPAIGPQVAKGNQASLFQ
jgi:lipoprotein-anchoring transpeptidase ErfK/SrfK